MPEKIHKVLVIGSGPIVIGQAAEFDYAGTQACKALREEGISTVLVNSNPATIMTDTDIADAVYIEPLTVETLERIIAQERPQGILPTLGGQTGLNLAVSLADAGILDQYSVRLLGTPLDTIRKAEDRHLFRELLREIGEPAPESRIARSVEEGSAAGQELGLPLVLRPAYTLGGTGGGLASTWEEFNQILRLALAQSPISQVLIERSLLGWKELEYEVMRDASDTCITVCNMENLDPMGVHTGDSIVVAPSQTLTDKEHQMLRSASLRIIRALGIQGGCNVQFALPPSNEVGKAFPGSWDSSDPYYVIEVNPRVSRSSALASKATGYPIARVAAKVAIGKRLHEIPNLVTRQTFAAFEPVLDYCVVKIPRWPFDKFSTADRVINTQMKSTGEVMAIDRTFEAALQKAIRALEQGGHSLHWEDPDWKTSGADILSVLPLHPNDLRLWALAAAIRRGASISALAGTTGIDPWFLYAIARIVSTENRLLAEDMTAGLMWTAKRMGFSDEYIGALLNKKSEQVRALRKSWDICPVYKMVDTCAAEFEAVTPYFYSAYETENEAKPLPGRKALVLGSGPIRIGQGIEFDYCSVHAAWALQLEGVNSIVVNSNPETVSTDFDTSNRLYFEPLDEEGLLDIVEHEALPGAEGSTAYPPSLVQFGGQTAINLSQALGSTGMPILGSTATVIDVASDRRLFEVLLDRLDIPKPPGGTITSLDEALSVADLVKYPVLVRPSYVLGGRAMEIVHTPAELIHYLSATSGVGRGRPVLIDKYLEGREVELDVLCDGVDILIPGIMEHVERAGVHSGDSMAVYPSPNLSEAEIKTIVEYTSALAKGLGAQGLLNIQYVITAGKENRSNVYVLEVNPRASRTVPFISKVTGVPVVELAVRIMLGRQLRELEYGIGVWPIQDLVAVKAPVFSMSKLAGVDSYLGPEMKSTGEVMGIDYTYSAAITKALEAAFLTLPPTGSMLLSVADHDKMEALPLARDLVAAGYRIYATEGTAAMLTEAGLPVIKISKKLSEGYPNVVDLIIDDQVVAVLNTTSGSPGPLKDGFEIRRAATERRIPCYTSIDTARAAIESLTQRATRVRTIQPISSYLKQTVGE